jgi:hypothetical protein
LTDGAAFFCHAPSLIAGLLCFSATASAAVPMARAEARSSFSKIAAAVTPSNHRRKPAQASPRCAYLRQLSQGYGAELREAWFQTGDAAIDTRRNVDAMLAYLYALAIKMMSSQFGA